MCLVYIAKDFFEYLFTTAALPGSQVFVLTVATKYPAFWVGMMGIISSDSLNVDLSQSRQL